MYELGKTISGEYSSHLDGMARWIKVYMEVNFNAKSQARTNKALHDFTFNNTDSFKRDFAKAIGIEKIPAIEIKENKDTPSIDEFVTKLSNKQSECVFLLRDTQTAFTAYQIKKGKGIGIAVNRSYLCRDEEDYFTLIDLLYKALDDAKTVDEVAYAYIKYFKKFISQNEHFYKKSLEISEYITGHTNPLQALTFVDYGFQFTFALFCLASVSVRGDSKRKLDYYAFSVYPWVQDIFRGKYLTEHNEVVIDLEFKSRKKFKEHILDKTRGCLLGFAIGDALGFPIAGIEKNDIPKYFSKQISGFEQNARHPYFSNLTFGQYTDNTNSVIISGENLLKSEGFDLDSYVKDLIEWSKDILTNEKKQRWIGPTMISGIKNLANGVPYAESGSKTTESCSSTYRVIPLALYYRPFLQVGFENLAEYASKSGMLTHNSDISKAGTVFVALLVSDLLNGILPLAAVEATIQRINWTAESNKLLEKIKDAIRMNDVSSVEEARQYFGTGSPIYQTLPLAIYYFLKYQNNFEEGILAAANSYREDSEEEKERLKEFSFQEQLLEARGGNSDGIAALTGAFLGAYLGESSIPESFRKVENYDLLVDLAERLVLGT